MPSYTSGSGGRREENLGFRSWFLIFQNVIGAMLSVPVLVTGILISRKIRGGGEDCATFLSKPIIAVGALLLLVSLAGLVAAIFDKLSRHPILAWFHLLLMFCLVILLFVFAIFCLELTNKGLAHSVTGYGQSYKEYRIYEYPKWMQHRVRDPSYWSNVKDCLQKSSICGAGDLPTIYSNITHESLAKLTPIQRGCCIPPSACNVTYLGVSNTKKANVEETTSQENNHNTTKLSKTTSEAMDITLHLYLRDCKHWSPLPQELCYECDTCRAGILQDSMDRWKDAAKIYVVLVIIMILLYAFFACYGFKEHSNTKSTN